MLVFVFVFGCIIVIVVVIISIVDGTTHTGELKGCVRRLVVIIVVVVFVIPMATIFVTAGGHAKILGAGSLIAAFWTGDGFVLLVLEALTQNVRIAVADFAA